MADVLHRLKTRCAAALIAALGRRNAVRCARFLLSEARFDVRNDLRTNGERLLQRRVLERFEESPLVVLDVGANIGDWSASAIELAGHLGRTDVALHAFEPAREAADVLELRLGPQAAPFEVAIVRVGLSDHAHSATLYVPGPREGASSLYQHSPAPQRRETVPLTTLDEYCAAHGLDSVALVKSDVEGHDVAVMQGGRRLLEAGKVSVWQFEYTWRWVAARRFLKDVFDLAQGAPYRVGKVTPKGLELYGRWDPELESFCEANYVLVREDRVASFPLVRWWKE